MKAPKGVRRLIKEAIDLANKIEVHSESGLDEHYQDKLISRLNRLQHWANDNQYLRVLIKTMDEAECKGKLTSEQLDCEPDD